ncbi:MAG: hypothetical protein NW223_20465 [Hyphomicrobiaceae bacterium]|nr:hypothetical protein [Hyphomicrobiaceae bacterium]
MAIFEGHLETQRTGMRLAMLARMPGAVVSRMAEVDTVFDLEARTVERQRRLLFGLCGHTERFAFTDIKGLGLKEYIDTDDSTWRSYLPVLTLRDGSRRYLAVLNAAATPYARAIEDICRQTGIPRLDHPGNKWGW